MHYTIAVSTATVTSGICLPNSARNSSVSICISVYFKFDWQLMDIFRTICGSKKIFQLWWVPWEVICVKFCANCRDTVLAI